MCSIRGDRACPLEACGFAAAAAAAAPAAMGAVRSVTLLLQQPLLHSARGRTWQILRPHRPARTRHPRRCLDPRVGRDRWVHLFARPARPSVMRPHRVTRVYRSCGSTRRTASCAPSGSNTPGRSWQIGVRATGPVPNLQTVQLLGRVPQSAVRRTSASSRHRRCRERSSYWSRHHQTCPPWSRSTESPDMPGRFQSSESAILGASFAGLTHPLSHARVPPVRLFAAQQAPSIGEPGAGDPHSTSSQQPASISVTRGTGSQGSR